MRAACQPPRASPRAAPRREMRAERLTCSPAALSGPTSRKRSRTGSPSSESKSSGSRRARRPRPRARPRRRTAVRDGHAAADAGAGLRLAPRAPRLRVAAGRPPRRRPRARRHQLLQHGLLGPRRQGHAHALGAQQLASAALVIPRAAFGAGMGGETPGRVTDPPEPIKQSLGPVAGTFAPWGIPLRPGVKRPRRPAVARPTPDRHRWRSPPPRPTWSASSPSGHAPTRRHFATRGQARYRVDQVLDWLYAKDAEGVEQMTNLPAAERRRSPSTSTSPPRRRPSSPARKTAPSSTSGGCTIGELIESVLIPTRTA